MKQIVIEACFINYGDDKGSQPAAVGDFVDINADTARDLARMGRTLYVDKKDDPAKGQLTASAEMLKAAEAAAKAARAADKPAA